MEQENENFRRIISALLNILQTEPEVETKQKYHYLSLKLLNEPMINRVISLLGENELNLFRTF